MFDTKTYGKGMDWNIIYLICPLLERKRKLKKQKDKIDMET